jgi:SAM-dependent methyltransferase
MSFKDHFSQLAAAYSAYRPEYPPELFEFVAGVASWHRLAWDCGTGNGQAARALADYFTHVVATDASAEQIAHAQPHENVDYRVSPAEASGLPDRSVDLVTVAQALHWFDHDAFYAEVRRVLRPGGAIVAWGYQDCYVDDPAIDAVIQQLNRDVVGSYWPPERRLIDDGYRTIPFPFREVPVPSITLEQSWTMTELAGYLRTWSATARYVAAHGSDPVTDIEPSLRALWSDPTTRRLVRWPVVLRAGYSE